MFSKQDLAHLQKCVYFLSKEYEANKNNIIQSCFTSDIKGIKVIAHEIFYSVGHTTKNINLYSLFIKDVSGMQGNILLLKDLVLANYIKINVEDTVDKSISYNYGKFLRYLYVDGLIDLEGVKSIIQGIKINILKNACTDYFYPELGKQEGYTSAWKASTIADVETFNKFALYDLEFEVKTINGKIRDNDRTIFEEGNQKITHNRKMVFCDIGSVELKVIEAAAYFGSFDIFIQLFNQTNKDYDDKLVEYALIGGNADILNVLDYVRPLNPSLLTSLVRFHHFNAFDAFKDRIRELQNHSVMYGFFYGTDDTPVSPPILNTAVSFMHEQMVVLYSNKEAYSYRAILTSAVSLNMADIVELYYSNNEECKERFVSSNGDLYTSISLYNDDVTKALVKYTTKLDKDFPCHLAASQGRKEIVALLLESGASYSAKNTAGETILNCAIKSNNKELVDYLVQNNYDLQLIDNVGYTALHMSVQISNLEFCKIFVNHCDINSKDSTGRTPLFLACQIGYLPIIQFLVTNNADVTIRNNQKQTPLHASIKRHDIPCIKYMSELPNIDPNILDRDGKSPLHTAILGDRREIVSIILKIAGADPNLACGNKKPIKLAKSKDVRALIVEAGGKAR